MSQISEFDRHEINRYNFVVDEILSHKRALSRIVARGLKIHTIIDVGASDGRWSIMAKNFGLGLNVIFSKPILIGELHWRN